MPALKVKPERDFPSQNSLHAVRGSWDVGNSQNSLPLTRAVWIPIGTLPRNVMVTSVAAGVSVAAAPATTIDVQFGETAPTDAIMTTAPLGTPGLVFAAAGVGGYRPNRTRVFARLNGAAALTAGQFDVLVQYYAKGD